MLEFRDPATRNLPAVLDAYARETPDNVFLMWEGGEETFASAAQSTRRLAAGLHAMGVGKGDRVVIIMGSRPEFVRLVLAVNRLGAIWVPINPDYRGQWLAQAIESSMPKALVIEGEFVENYRKACPDAQIPCAVLEGDPALVPGAVSYASLSDHGIELPPVDISYGDTAAILWTSGTTGKPKGVMQSHNAWIYTAESGNRMWGTGPDDIAYNCLPLFNSGAWTSAILRALVAGIPVAMDPTFSVSKFWSRIAKFKATQTMTLGAMHIFLWNQPVSEDEKKSTLRSANFTPIPEHLIEPFMERFGLEQISQGYGQSEAMALFQRASVPGSSFKANCLGRPNPDFEFALLDDDGNAVEQPGVPGEISVKAKIPFTLFNGYFNNPEATAGSRTGDWYRTGDMGMRDADGDWFFVDRKQDSMRYKGHSVSSFMVETATRGFPGIAQCAAFGIPSKELAAEHEIKLDVVPLPGETVDPAALAQFMLENAPKHFVPRYIEIVESLPHTPTNKVEKYKLRERGVGPNTWDRFAGDNG